LQTGIYWEFAMSEKIRRRPSQLGIIQLALYCNENRLKLEGKDIQECYRLVKKETGLDFTEWNLRRVIKDLKIRLVRIPRELPKREPGTVSVPAVPVDGHAVGLLTKQVSELQRKLDDQKSLLDKLQQSVDLIGNLIIDPSYKRPEASQPALGNGRYTTAG
jgi:hypothetical protein